MRILSLFILHPALSIVFAVSTQFKVKNTVFPALYPLLLSVVQLFDSNGEVYEREKNAARIQAITEYVFPPSILSSTEIIIFIGKSRQ